MVWAILALLGVPLWLCAAGILVVVFNNHRLRTRPGNVPVRVKRPDKDRWTRAHGLWVSDVFLWRGNPAAWREDLRQVTGASPREPDAEETKKLHRLGDEVCIAELKLADGGVVHVAAAADRRDDLLGPFR